MYEMKDEYLIGIPEIDEEHRKLFEIAESVYQLKKQEFLVDKYDQIRDILRDLKKYTIQHFENEEAYMEKIGYKKMFTQKIEHNEFRAKIEEIDIDNLNEDEVLEEILVFLTNWLVNHILETDMQIAQADK